MSSLKDLKNWGLFSLTALLLSIQALLLMMKAVNFFEQLPQFVILGIGLVLFIIGQIAAVIIYKHRAQTGEKENGLRAFLIVEAVLTFFLLSALVKTIFYDYKGEMAQRAYNILLILAVLNKWFWPQVRETGRRAWVLINARANEKILRSWTIVIGTVLLPLIIFVPHFERVLARMYIGEQFHHYDIFVMSSGWAAYNHHLIDVDQTSQYGVGMPYIFAELCRWMGGFSYSHVFLIIMTGTMIYYVLFFWLSLRWFKSAAFTLALMLWAIRVQMFHPGDYPFVLTYPSTTVIRYFFDIFFFAAIFCHLRRGRPAWLLAAAVVSGISVFYMDCTGVFLVTAYYAYLTCLLSMPYTRSMLYRTQRDLAPLGGYFLLPVAVIFVFFYKTVGHHMFTAQFFQNMTSIEEYYLSGIWTYPIYNNFIYHNFWAGLVGFIIPAVWVFTMIFAGGMCYFKKFSRQNILIIVVCVYGLGVNHYYVVRALLTCYYVTALPFIFVCGWWLKLLLWSWPRRVRTNAIMASLFISAWALVTNHNFMAYPNIFNFSRNPMVDMLTAQPLPADLSTYFNHLYRNDPAALKLPANSLGQTDEELLTEKDFKSDDELTAYYRREYDFTKDAGLIKSLTLPGSPVAVISAFETKILMQADRPPLFYYFPLLSSRPKHMRTMPLNFLHTSPGRFNRKAIQELEEARPEYVFLERIFLYDYPKAYADKPENIIPIVDYVRLHYAPYKAGEYLMAMKRK